LTTTFYIYTFSLHDALPILTFPGRKGFPFILKRFLRKKEIITGIVLGFLFIFFLSNIIWKVEINGVPTDMEEKMVKKLNSYGIRSEEHTSELQSRFDLVCRL